MKFVRKKNKIYICNAVRMLSTIAACGTLKKEIGLRRDSEAFLLCPFSIIPSLPSVDGTDGSFLMQKKYTPELPFAQTIGVIYPNSFHKYQ